MLPPVFMLVVKLCLHLITLGCTMSMEVRKGLSPVKRAIIHTGNIILLPFDKAVSAAITFMCFLSFHVKEKKKFSCSKCSLLLRSQVWFSTISETTAEK